MLCDECRLDRNRDSWWQSAILHNRLFAFDHELKKDRSQPRYSEVVGITELISKVQVLLGSRESVVVINPIPKEFLGLDKNMAQKEKQEIVARIWAKQYGMLCRKKINS